VSCPVRTRGEVIIKVNIEVLSWLKEDFDHGGWDKLLLEETVSQGTSIVDLLHLLSKKYPKFGKKAFADPHQSFFDYCAVISNGTFLSALVELNTELKEGDNIKLSPGFYGG
jgi:molybdopterin converting factor small subunit